MSFVAELKRRNVIRMAGLYLVGAWLVVQVTGTLLPIFGAPEWLPRSVVLLLAIGLVPVLAFSWVYELTPEGLKREREVDPTTSITPDTGRRIDRAILALLVLAVGIFALDRFVLAPRRMAAVAPAEKVEPAAEAVVSNKSIAVLPLVNAGGNKDEQFFSDGLSENLIIALSQLDALTVIGRNSSFQFRDTKDDSKSIGAKLGVANLLEGSVQHVGDLVRVSAELIDAATGRTLWSQRYDRPYKDLFALQDDITREVASALKTKLLTSVASAQSDRPPSGKLEAYTAFLQGRFYAARFIEADDREAIAQFTQATRIDPGYALAWAELSHAATGMAARFLAGEAAQQAYRQAREAANTALALAPELAAAHGALGYVRLTADFDWAGAEAEYRRGLELAPNDGSAKFGVGELLAALGRPEEAVELTRQALTTDPLNARWHSFLSQYLVGLGRVDEAREAALKAIAVNPGGASVHEQLAIIEILRGDAKAALAAAQEEPAGNWRDLALALAHQVGGDSAAAESTLKTVIDKYASIAPYQIAEIQALRNDADKTFEWLDRAWTSRDPGIEYLLTDPLILRFRADPRFAAFCKKVGLPATTSAKAMGEGPSA